MTSLPRPPRTVRVLGQRFQTFVGPNRANVVAAATCDGEHEDTERVGHTNLSKGVCGIDSNQSEDQIADTVLHEWLHVMLMLVGHDDEQLVFRLSPVLLDFIRRNPRAVEYLVGGNRRLVRW